MVVYPKTPLAAAAIFLSGCVIIAYTINDIQRTTQCNETPMSQEQLQSLKQMVDDHRTRSSGAWYLNAAPDS